MAYDWIKTWRQNLPNIDPDRYQLIKVHSIRKTFAQLALRSGMNLMEISQYGDWKLPSCVLYYVAYDHNYALNLIQKLLINQPKKEYKTLSIDMDHITQKKVKMYT